MNLAKMEEALKAQVHREYEQGFNHVREERERKRDILEKVLPVTIPDGQVRVNLLWKNIQLENALFLNDEIDIKFIAPDGVLSRELVKNMELVAKYDNVEMDLYELREDIINQNALYGLAATCVDWWDSDEKQPIADSIDPLSIIPDPKNWRGSKMRFIGFERRVTKEYLENNTAFKNLERLKDTGYQNPETRKTEQSIRDANNTNTISSDMEWYVDIYDHYTIYDGKKWLTTWGNGIDVLIRCVEIEPLTDAEKQKPNKVKFPIQLHRRKPKINSFFGVSIADEILQYQDAISQLTNLQLLQARQHALWPDKFVDQNLGIDVSLLANKLPGWRIIPVRANGNIWNSIYNDVPVNPSQFPAQMKQEMTALSQETTGANNLAFGQSIKGSQTKAEVQTLMQNTNQILSYIASNYLRGQKSYWQAHYRAYCLYMGSKDKKVISLWQNGKNISASLKKKEFIGDGKVSIYVTSKSQQAIQNQKDFAKMISIANLYLANMKPWYAMNQFLRKLGDSLGVDGFDSMMYIQPSIDEEIAMRNLDLLNDNIEISPPEPGEDFKTYLDIYKQALDTPAKFKAIAMYEEAYLSTRQMAEPTGQTDNTTAGMAMNMVNNQLSQQSQIPSTQQVTA